MTPRGDLFRRGRAMVKSLPPALERRTHIALADTMRVALRRGWWFSHIGHGEARSEKTGALLQRMGLKPGLLDFLLIDPNGRHHWLELKRGLAPLTDGQELFVAMCRERNVLFFVARSYDAAIEQLKRWGAM